MIIIGLDPGLNNTGWGIIDCASGRLSFVAAGVIKPSSDLPMADRLKLLFAGILRVLEEHQPHTAAVEETFVNTNPRSALILGQARGIALMTPAFYGIPVAEYAANTIKKSVVGAGHADKTQVQAMIKLLLPASGAQAADAADALAVAICHSHFAETANRWKVG
jgi:crossover junction endodeoxyribonuclease RuvC